MLTPKYMLPANLQGPQNQNNGESRPLQAASQRKCGTSEHKKGIKSSYGRREQKRWLRRSERALKEKRMRSATGVDKRRILFPTESGPLQKKTSASPPERWYREGRRHRRGRGDHVQQRKKNRRFRFVGQGEDLCWTLRSSQLTQCANRGGEGASKGGTGGWEEGDRAAALPVYPRPGRNNRSRTQDVGHP